MTMLFSKRINEITYEDVLAFCKEGHEEGIRLDYKVDWPKDLAKVMAAMANTFGGLILVGVDEEDRKPKLPIAGVKFTSKERLSQKVASTAFDAIYPPLFPEVAVCELPSKRRKKPDRAVIIIRVHESHETAHTVENGTKVYQRVADQTKPRILEKLADIDTIQWLLNKRQRAIELRQMLIEDAVTRFRNYCAELAIQKRPDQLESLREHGTDDLKLSFLIVPTFPRDALVSLDELYNWGWYSPDGRRILSRFVRYKTPIPIPGGVRIVESLPKEGRHPYVELNQFGLFCSFVEYEQKDETNFDPDDGCFHIHFSLQIASAFYEMLGFQGSLLVKVELTEVLGKTLGRQSTKYTAYQPTILAFERQLYATEFHAQADALYEEICRNVFWAFGWKGPEGCLERPQF